MLIILTTRYVEHTVIIYKKTLGNNKQSEHFIFILFL